MMPLQVRFARREAQRFQLGAMDGDLALASKVLRALRIALAVLARGYAVFWKDDRTRIIRDADTVTTGDEVNVTIERGELTCTVKDRRR